MSRKPHSLGKPPYPSRGPVPATGAYAARACAAFIPRFGRRHSRENNVTAVEIYTSQQAACAGLIAPVCASW